MSSLVLPAIPRLGPTSPHWTEDQRRDLIAYWQDIKKVLDSMRRATGLTGAISTGQVIQHGLGFIPSFILITAQDSGPTDIHPSGITATAFTLNFGGGGTHVFGWSAEP